MNNENISEKEKIITAIKRHILLKLVEHRYWQHKHTNINNLPKSLPTHLKNSGYTKTAIKELINKNFLISKPTSYGLELSLNIRMKKEIEDSISNN
jgi:hypothetical protein